MENSSYNQNKNKPQVIRVQCEPISTQLTQLSSEKDLIYTHI